ncbi:MAG: ABC transporter permease [Promethearchaeota archaeon]
MGVILKIALRNMKRRKLRYILTTITLVISVALFGGVLIVSDSFHQMMLNTFDEQLGTADILIRTTNSTDSWFDPDEIDLEIRNVEHVESVAYRISGYNIYVSSIDNGTQADNGISTGIYGINPQNRDEQKLGGTPYIIDSISNGETIEELLDYTHEITGDKVVVISESLKIQLGGNFTVNKSIWIYPNEGDELGQGYDPRNTGTWIEYTVVAIIRDTSEARDFDPEGTSTSSMMGLGLGPGIFANINNTHELVDGTENHTGEYTLGVVGVDNIYRISSVAENIQTQLTDLDDEKDWVVNDLKSDSIEQIDTSMSIMRTMFSLFGIIALILSIILMMNIFNIIKKEQEYETGMFQAIGASKSETFKMFLTQGIVMGIIGTSIGTMFSFLISYVIMSVTFQSLTEITSQFEGVTISNFEIILYPSTLIITFIVGFISCVLASLYPSWKASRKPIIECLNPIEEKSKREKRHYLKRIVFLILGGLLIYFGILLMDFGSESTFEVQSNTETPGGGSMVTGMFGPMFILFGMIWIMVLCIKPLNRMFTFFFSPYLQKTRLLTEKNILRHRRRTALTFTLITLTTSFLIGISVMMDSMRSGINTTINDFMGGDIRIFTYGTPKSFEDGIINQSGVDDAMGTTFQNAQIQMETELVGHSMLDDDWNKTITINVLDTTKVREHLTKSIIVSPEKMTLDEMMDEIEENNNIIIDEQFAKEYNVKVGDHLPINFSLGLDYANFTAFLYMDDYNANEVSLVVNMSVVAIVRSIQGFVSLDLFGMSEGKTYNMYISWDVYEEIASKNLPGGGTDLVFRQKENTGIPEVDNFLPSWFNFSTVETIMNSINGIDYYTTRMDYFTATFNGSVVDSKTSVVGIHTNSSGRLKSDSYFGNNSLIEQQLGYEGSTMEELLNKDENICVVDETFIKYHPSAKIGDNINIFSQDAIYDPYSPWTWPSFEIVGIIEAPTLYNAERYNWDASYETAFDVIGTNGSIYVNYEKARNIIYEDYKGSNYFDDNVTSVLVHCEHPSNNTICNYMLQLSLPLSANWSIIDVKSLTLYMRTSVYDWFVWIEDGVKDEVVLEEAAQFIHDSGYLIIFSFTRSFIKSTFNTLLNLIVFITNGLLFLCIIIAMIGLTLHSLLTTMARRREIGMLRSIGLSRKAVIRSISGESLILAILGLFGGITAGLTLGSFMVSSIPGGGFLTVTYTVPWLTLFILVLVVLVTVILSSRYPAKWAANLNIIDAVRTR